MLAVFPLARFCPAGKRRGHRAPLPQMGYTGVTEDFIVADPKGGGTLEKLTVAIGPIRLKARQTRYGVRAAPPAAILPRPTERRADGLGPDHRLRLPGRRCGAGKTEVGVTP